MTEIKLKSIRISLLILTSLIFIPLFAVILYSSHIQKEKAYRLASENALNLARHLSDQQKFIESNTRQFLTVLSQLPELKNDDTNKLNLLLNSLLTHTPIYASLLIADIHGEVIASGIPYSHLNVNDRKYFRDAITNKTFSVGEYTKGRLSQKAVIHYAFPLLDKGGNVMSVLIASFNLAYYDNFLKTTQLADNAAFTITDHNDVILYHSPNQHSTIGEKEFFKIKKDGFLNKQEGTFISTASDGIKRLYGFQRLSLAKNENYINIYVGIPERIAFAEYRKTLISNILIWFLTAVFILATAYFFSYKYILKPIDQLVNIADSIADGNLQVKTGNINTSSEINKLSLAFSSMTEKLSQRDIERNKVEKDLKKLKERFELAINSAKIGIWDWHIRTDSLIWDKNMFDLYGIDFDKFEGTLADWKSHIFAEDLMTFEENVLKALELHQPFRSEFRIIHPTIGIKSIRIFASVIEDKEGKPARLIGVNWDISERKILENQLNEAKERAERNDRLKSVFFADISHEIRTPLHGIIGFAQILKDNDATLQERMQYLDIIVYNGNKLLTVISDIIDISLIDAGQLKLVKKEVDVTSLVYDLFDYYDKLRVKEKKQFQLLLEMESDSPILMEVDSFRFNQLFSNLLENIFRYNTCGEITIGCCITNNELCCFVKDYGTGLNKGQLVRIFDKFRKNDDVVGTNYSENGLGLIICKGLVELMGGTIWANCNDTTTEFYFNLPLRQPDTYQANYSYQSDLIV